jgi:serine/threonine protein kinase
VSQNAESFGKYILLEKVAMGGMAEVYLAKNQGAGGIAKFVAIKRILPQYSENANFIDMFKTEARIAVNLAHSNIVSIHEFGIEKEQFFIVMDFVEGRNLRQILNKMKKSNLSFSVEQVLYVVKEIAGGLDHAHRCLDGSTGKPLNIIHRDMSPQNVMVNFEGEVKIVDFGIAKAETQLETTRAGELKGKFGYMSPEQAEGQVVDLRTDIFSLGIVLWELLANDRLFIANNEVNTLRKIRECQIPSLRKINPNIPQELERIVGKALAKDRNLRYQTSAALNRELSRFLNRQFPDFSSHDFSIFIKTLFAGEILESRKKQIEYAKIEVNPPKQVAPPAPEKTVLTQTTPSVTEATEPDSHTPSNAEGLADFGNVNHDKRKIAAARAAALLEARAQASKEAQQEAKQIDQILVPLHQDSSDRKREPDFNGQSRGNRKPTQSEQDINTAGLRVQRSPSFRDGSTREGTFTGSGSYQGTYYGTRSVSKQKPSRLEFLSPGALIPMLLVCSLIFGAAMYIKSPEKTLNFITTQLERTGYYKRPVGSPTIEQFSSVDPPSYAIVPINTTPPGAEIIIDGNPYPDVTPTSAQISLPTGKSKVVHIILKMHGFVKSEENIDLERNPSINRILKSDQKGYLNIAVVGSGQIYVNNRLVAMSSPANNIEVPANEDIKVKSFDPATNAIDERIVHVDQNKIQSVTLIPRAPRFRPEPEGVKNAPKRP